jgi:hypothetical protein
MNFIKKLFSKKKIEKFDPEEVINKPYKPKPIDKPENPFNPIPVPKDPTIKDK